ncbi:serine protease [Pelomonas sp. APW6]|uniref:Serine protease n=1 Tax=Roseateles subflavus TaxID=3053353 RepID=A0ABT7LFV8_9BURK|nr:serine protease [Pelomonas sp. APW6]MDL5031729.1 serine protease [Pelomonas sp. APW6]
MKNLQEATERICELKGGMVALDALLPAVMDSLSAAGLLRLSASFDAHAETARTLMLHSEMSDIVLAAFEREVARHHAVLQRGLRMTPATPDVASIDPMWLAVTPLEAFRGPQRLCRNSAFFYRKGDALFLVSTQSAFAGSRGAPVADRVDIEVAMNAHDAHLRARCSLPLLSEGRPLWHAVHDQAGPTPVAALPIASRDLPAAAVILAFDETHMADFGEDIAIGDVISMVGFPESLSHAPHAVPIARSGAIASPYAWSFQGRACFLTDLVSSAGCGGAAILRRRAISRSASAPLAWQLLAIHACEPLEGAPAGASGAEAGLFRAWSAQSLRELQWP